MHFSSGINRPPYETADGYLQTTQGCSHNSCLHMTMVNTSMLTVVPGTPLYRAMEYSGCVRQG